MNRDIVIVPTFDRPEYLWLCLQKLSHAPGIENKEVWVCEDNHDGKDTGLIRMEMREVSDVGDMRFPDRFRWIRREPHSSYGNSYNVLEAFREAFSSKAERVYLVEDDVLVMPDFFQWHEAAHRQWSPFVSCAGRINNSLNFERNGREAIDESCKDLRACVASSRAYGSWAACFNRPSLGCILYSVDQARVLESIGPGREQDIWIQCLMPRIQMYTKPAYVGFAGSGKVDFDPTGFVQFGFSVWPYVPRAYHMGMKSYHRTCGLSFNGTLQEKIEQLQKTVTDLQKIRSIGLSQDDIDPYPTTPLGEWNEPLFLKADYR